MSTRITPADLAGWCEHCGGTVHRDDAQHVLRGGHLLHDPRCVTRICDEAAGGCGTYQPHAEDYLDSVNRCVTCEVDAIAEDEGLTLSEYDVADWLDECADALTADERDRVVAAYMLRAELEGERQERARVIALDRWLDLHDDDRRLAGVGGV